MATLRQKRAIAKIVEYRGKSIGKAMLEVGYSPKSAKNPKNLTQSKGWDELMQTHFPDADLAKLHKKLLEKKEAIVVSDGTRDGSHIEWTGQPHSDSIRALDTAYKLKKKFPTESGPTNNVLVINLANETAVRYDPKPIASDSSELSK